MLYSKIVMMYVQVLEDSGQLHLYRAVSII